MKQSVLHTTAVEGKYWGYETRDARWTPASPKMPSDHGHIMVTMVIMATTVSMVTMVTMVIIMVIMVIIMVMIRDARCPLDPCLS